MHGWVCTSSGEVQLRAVPPHGTTTRRPAKGRPSNTVPAVPHGGGRDGGTGTVGSGGTPTAAAAEVRAGGVGDTEREGTGTMEAAAELAAAVPSRTWDGTPPSRGW